uniref:Uncharacterized protein n=1 Tax=Ixodes ricinus TaxID=34613 RepID=A0A6B0V4D1_IXORI
MWYIGSSLSVSSAGWIWVMRALKKTPSGKFRVARIFDEMSSSLRTMGPSGGRLGTFGVNFPTGMMSSELFWAGRGLPFWAGLVLTAVDWGALFGEPGILKLESLMKTSKKWTSGIISASACSLLFFSLSFLRSRSILSKAMSISMNSRSRSWSSPSLRENLSISSFQACSRSEPPITLFTVAMMSQSQTTNCSFSSRWARFTPEGPSPLAPSGSPSQSPSLLRAESVIPLPSPNASAALFFLRFPLSP